MNISTKIVKKILLTVAVFGFIAVGLVIRPSVSNAVNVAPTMTTTYQCHTVETVKFAGKNWIVVGGNVNGVKKGVAGPKNTATLWLAKGSTFGQKAAFGKNNEYATSGVKVAMEQAYASLKTSDKKMIVPRTLTGGSGNYKDDNYNDDGIRGASVAGAAFWPLSEKEADKTDKKIRPFDSSYWLRTPAYDDSVASYVTNSGLIAQAVIKKHMYHVGSEIGVRPAFYIDIKHLHLKQTSYIQNINNLRCAKIQLGTEGIANHYTYTGKNIKPTVKFVEMDYDDLVGVKLKINKDYKLKYTNNKQLGVATLTITGQGKYAGKVQVHYLISGPDLDLFADLTTSRSGSSLKVSWAKVENASKYELDYRIQGKGDWTKVTTSDLTKTLTDLKAGSKYELKVRAFKKIGTKIFHGAYSPVKVS
jgi:hypothetical protein